MAHNQRIDSILTIISRRRTVTVQELKQRLGVSEVTIRKDLDILESEGIICRTHGGAMMAEDRTLIRPIEVRSGEHIDQKLAIAKAARKLVSNGDTIYIDAGSTCHLFAGELKDMDVQVVTNSLEVIKELAELENISLYALGGSFRRQARSFIGPGAVTALSNYQIKVCFMGTTGFSADGSFASQNTLESDLKRQALKVSGYRVVLTDSSKYGVSAFSVFAKSGDVDLLVTDSDFTQAKDMLDKKIEVMLVDYK